MAIDSKKQAFKDKILGEAAKQFVEKPERVKAGYGDVPEGAIAVCVVEGMQRAHDAVEDICSECGGKIWHDPDLPQHMRCICFPCAAPLFEGGGVEFVTTQRALNRALETVAMTELTKDKPRH